MIPPALPQPHTTPHPTGPPQLRRTPPPHARPCQHARQLCTPEGEAALTPVRHQFLQIHTIIWRAHNVEEVLDKILKEIGGEVMTYFPPDSNGYLHFGHVKYSNLSSKQDCIFQLTESTQLWLSLMRRN